MLALNYNAEGQFTILPSVGEPFRWRFKIALCMVIRRCYFIICTVAHHSDK